MSMRFSYKIILWPWPFYQWPWIKVIVKIITLPWIQCNNFVKFYSIHELIEKLWLKQCQKSQCVHTVTFHQWPGIKALTLPWVQCNNSVKYYSNSCFHWKTSTRTMFISLWQGLRNMVAWSPGIAVLGLSLANTNMPIVHWTTWSEKSFVSLLFVYLKVVSPHRGHLVYSFLSLRRLDYLFVCLCIATQANF
jgi:hypothetical protein